MSNPIPRRLLIHSGSYASYTGTVSSKRQYATTVTLTAVRFEPVKQNAMTNLGDMKNDRFRLFYDCHNSRPSGLVMKPGDQVVFGGQTLAVRVSVPCYGAGPAVHHYEVQLV